MFRVLLATAALTGLILSCGEKKSDNYTALHLEYMDSSVSAADDFYNHVNGRWMKTAVIPADKGRWGAFEQLDLETDKQALTVLDDAVKSGKIDKNTDQGKAVTLYQTVLDTVNRNKQGVAPLMPYLKEIDNITSIEQLNQYIEKYIPWGESTLFGLSVDADAKNSNKTALYLTPCGLGLPERDYYLKTDSQSVKIQMAYKQFVAKMLAEFNMTENAGTLADNIFNLEKKLATAMLTKEQRRDPVRQYNPMTAESAAKMMTALALPKFTASAGINPDTVIVTEPAFIKAMNSLVNDKNLSDLKLLFKWASIRGAASLLNDKTEELRFGFYGKTLRGTPAMKPRKERALDMVNSLTGEALGKLYVEKYFPAEAKMKAKELVDDLIAAYRVRINNLSWMSSTTKAKAQKKLDKLTIKIGYPDKWRDYSKLEIKSYADGGTYLQNVMNASRFEVMRNMAKYGKPVDKTEWYMSPQTVNAYYNPAFNEIVFPASILQAPFFDFRNDAAVNFGGIGAVIGHEISHGFDDQGAQYDEFGNLVNWWTEEDLKKFKLLGKKLIDQYNGYEALPGQFVNGEFTLGENIGDLGGVASAYDGLQIYLKRKPDERKNIQGLTPEQRFFFSWATVWRNKIRDEELSMRLKTDPHSPGYFRAIGPLQNHEGFYKAFNVKDGNKMYRSDSNRVQIW